MNIIINSNQKIQGSSPCDAMYNIDSSCLEDGCKYKVNWKFTKSFLTDFQSLLLSKPPWAQYTADNIGVNILTDITGNNRHATMSNVSKASFNGNGSSVSINYLYGSPTSTILFPTGSVGTNFKLASLTRYETVGIKTRILTSTGNWLHGHWNGFSGCCYYNVSWLTPNNVVNNNWCNMIGNNTLAAPNNFIYNKNSNGIASGGNGDRVFSINISDFPLEKSDFQFAQLIIWNISLSYAEELIVTNAIDRYLLCGQLL